MPQRVGAFEMAQDHDRVSVTLYQAAIKYGYKLDPTDSECLAGSRQALKDAGLTPRDIDEVILVGGMTRMPAVQERVKKDIPTPTIINFLKNVFFISLTICC